MNKNNGLQEYECTALFVDIRNFTGQLNDESNSDSFIELLEQVYSTGIEVTSTVVGPEQCYINSTGDGYLIVVFGNDHFLSGFLIGLMLHKKLSKVFADKTNKVLEDGDYFFGIGIESGSVKRVSAKIRNTKIETYIGNVINIAARLEALSKDHARAPIIYGPELNKLLVKKLLNEDYDLLMKQAKSMDNPEELHRKMSLINAKLLSSYLFEHKLKGIKKHMPIFRISPTLFLSSDQAFTEFKSCLPIEYQKRLSTLNI